MESKGLGDSAGTEQSVCCQYGTCFRCLQMAYNEDFPVVCMDELPKQLIEQIASTPMKPGQETRFDYENIRHGMVNFFIANEPLRGNRVVEVTEYKTKKDWAKFIKRISDEMYPQAKKI